MGKKIDLTGRTFGRLKVERLDHIGNRGRTFWLCNCSCGNSCVKAAGNLLSQGTLSCGCLHRQVTAERNRQNAKHHASETRLYNIWSGMKQRCSNPHHKSYADYGGRGIFVCDEWLDFPNFRLWALANGYEDSASIDRIDNDAPYTPENCRWVSAKTQANNRRTSRFIKFRGESMTLTEFCEKYSNENLSVDTIRQRIKKGHSPEEAISKPARITRRGENQ